MNATRGNSPGPPGNTHRYETIEHIYYDRDNVVVTDRWLVITGRRYDVSQLDDLRTVRGAHHPMVTAVAGVAGLVIFAVALGLPFFYHDPTAWLGVTVVSIVPVAAAVAAWRLQPRPYELWGRYHGGSVRLLWCPDQKTYGHVCRALIRAREAQPDHARVLPPAA